jgi:acyl-coenzyme A thioesterase PaaI-like protein
MTLAEKVFASAQVLQRTGMQLAAIEPNRVHLKMPLDGNTGAPGVMYAGSLFALAEAAPGLLLLNKFDPARFGPTCASVNIRFRRPAKSDVDLHMSVSNEQFSALEKEAIEKGKASADFNLDLTDQKGEAVAVAEVKYVLFKI